MGTLSSIAAATRIAASVVATLIFNGHNAMVSRNRRFSLHSGNSFEMASRFCFRSSFFSLSLAFISSFLEEVNSNFIASINPRLQPNYRSGEKGPKVSLLTRKWSNSFVSFSFDDKERRHLTLSLPIDSSDKSDPWDVWMTLSLLSLSLPSSLRSLPSQIIFSFLFNLPTGSSEIFTPGQANIRCGEKLRERFSPINDLCPFLPLSLSPSPSLYQLFLTGAAAN